MALRMQVVKNLRLRSGKSNYNTDIAIEIEEGEIFEIAIEIDFEISVISMILRLPEILEIMPTLLSRHPERNTYGHCKGSHKHFLAAMNHVFFRPS